MKPTIEEMAEEVIRWLPKEEQELFLTTDVILHHHTLGRSIRNHFKLWTYKWEPELRDGVDYSENHPDAISTRVMEEVKRKLKESKC